MSALLRSRARESKMTSTADHSTIRPGTGEPREGDPFVSVVVCTHNRSAELQRYALPSLVSLTYLYFEVVVIDDASSDDTAAVVSRFQARMPNLRYVMNDKHHSLCHVRNLGVASSRGAIIAFIDDDCEVDSSWLTELVRPYICDAKVMAVAGKVFLGDTGQEAKSPVGCNMSFRASLFEDFQFDTNLTYSHWGDEADLFEMMSARNIPVVLAAKATVRHHISPSPFRPDKIGWSLNALYSFGKQHSLITYFAALLVFSGMFLHGTVNQRYWVSRHASQFAIGSLVPQLENIRSSSSLAWRFIWVYYVILIEIPWKLILWKYFRRKPDRIIREPTA